MDKYLISFFEKNNLDLMNKRIVIAVSTGVDSMVMLDCFLKNKAQYHFNITVAHMNHQKREQSTEEEQFIKFYCSRNGIGCFTEKIKSFDYKNFQSYARDKRYEFFKRVLDEVNGDYLILAHHANDHIETIMMRLIRGSNLKGYSGMDEISTFHNRILLRPFLCILKQDLIDYAHHNHIKYYQDYSNEDDVYTRNRIRKEIIPSLFNEDNNVHLKFIDFSNTLKAANKIVEDRVITFIKDHQQQKGIIFNRKDFLDLSDFLQVEVIFYILKKYLLSKVNVLEIIKLINSEKQNLKIVYKKMFTFVKEYDEISFFDYVIPEFRIDLVIEAVGKYKINDSISINVINKRFDNDTKIDELWYNSNMLPLRIRTRKNGDKILLEHGYKKIKDLLIEQKFGILKREKVLIVEKDDEILAVLGVKKSALLNNIRDNDILIKVENKDG